MNVAAAQRQVPSTQRPSCPDSSDESPLSPGRRLSLDLGMGLQQPSDFVRPARPRFVGRPFDLNHRRERVELRSHLPRRREAASVHARPGHVRVLERQLGACPLEHLLIWIRQRRPLQKERPRLARVGPPSCISSTSTQARSSPYLDPDILAAKPVRRADRMHRQRRELRATAHTRVGRIRRVRCRKFLLFGTYNLGFCCLRDTPQTRRVVSWWSRRLEAHCLIDLPNGLFVD